MLQNGRNKIMKCTLFDRRSGRSRCMQPKMVEGEPSERHRYWIIMFHHRFDLEHIQRRTAKM